MPDQIIGVTKEIVPSEEQGTISLTVVIYGTPNNYSTYIGEGSPEWIVEHGIELDFDEMEKHFRGIGQVNRQGFKRKK